MSRVTVRYKPDHKGIHGFLHSPAIQTVNALAGSDVIRHATGQSQHLDGHWKYQRGPDLTIGLYSRATGRVVNDAQLAASIEFGTGMGRPGQTGKRPQGGYSFPHRILAKAGSRVGEYGEAPG